MDAISGQEFDVCIVGDGPAGLTLALALAHTDFSIVIVSRNDAPERPSSRDGRYYSIASGCWNIFRALGVAELLESKAQAIHEISAESGGNKPIIFEDSDLAEDADYLGFMIGATALNEALQQVALQHPSISYLFSQNVEAYEARTGGINLNLKSNNESVLARLLVGCDGRQSIVRRKSGIRWFGHDYNAASITALVKLSQPHEGRARQTFLKSGPLAVLPLPNSCANIIWTESSETAQALVALNAEDFALELAERSKGFVGEFDVLGPRSCFPLTMRVAERFYADRVALAGDAAHSIHPLAGQGLNLGLKDVATLAEELVKADRLGLDFGGANVLNDYDSKRRPDVVSTSMAMDAFDTLFTSAPSPLRSLASAGMELMGGLKPFRTAMAQRASALSDHQPRLMQGLQL